MYKKIIAIVLMLVFQLGGLCNETQDTSASPSESQTPATYTAAQQARDVQVFSHKNKFGLKDNDGNVVAPAVYQKIIMAGRYGWIVQKHNKYGLMDSQGKYLIKPKYRNADRIFGRYIKLGNDNDYGIYNEYGEEILPPVYSSIDLLYGKMFLTYKDYRYGISDFSGNVIIPNICDDIYMPARDTIRIKYLGVWYEMKDANADALKDLKNTLESNTSDFKMTSIVTEPGTVSEYSVLTVSDYFIKVFSSISPAHEETIDSLILSHGVDTVGILKKFSWVPKYPVTFVKKYVAYLRNPYNGPLADKRNKLKSKR